MAKNKSSFNMLPDDINISQTPSVTDDTNVTENVNVTPVTNNANVTNATQTIEPIQTINPIQMQQPIVTEQVELKKRVYVNITMDHYLFAKKKTGASLGTLQDYFDALIEYDKQHHIISYGGK